MDLLYPTSLRYGTFKINKGGYVSNWETVVLLRWEYYKIIWFINWVDNVNWSP